METNALMMPSIVFKGGFLLCRGGLALLFGIWVLTRPAQGALRMRDLLAGWVVARGIADIVGAMRLRPPDRGALLVLQRRRAVLFGRRGQRLFGRRAKVSTLAN